MAIVIPYVKQTWTDGSGGGTPISAARLGVLEEGILDVSQAPAVRVTHNTTQSITNTGAFVALAFNTERFDQAGGAASTQHDTVTNNSRLTCLYAGVYMIWGNWQWASTPASGSYTCAIRLNGATELCRSNPVSLDIRSHQISTIASLAVNDYVELCLAQNTAGAININSAAQISPEFAMVRVA